MKQTDILILGAGIGGYEAFRTLKKQLKRYGLRKKITLVDKESYFTFVPLLHEVATGSVLSEHASLPLRELVYDTNHHEFLRTEVLSIDPEKKTVTTTQGDIAYEYCVIALGSKINFFNTPGTEMFARDVRTLRAATHLHNELFHLLETKTQASIVVVGGGYTGIELAGQLADLKQKEIKKLYPHHTLSITVVQSGPEIIPNLPPKARLIATERLKSRGVNLITNTQVTKVRSSSVALSSGDELSSDLTIWSTGFENIAPCFLSASLCEKGRVPVNEHVQLIKHPHTYAIGDIALFKNQPEEAPIPQLGEVAHLEGEYVAMHIVASIRQKTIRPFGFDQHISLMPIGNWFGLMILWNKYVFTGRFAWWLRRTAYVLFMPGIIRRIRIVIDWTLQSFGFRYTMNIDDVVNSKTQTTNNK